VASSPTSRNQTTSVNAFTKQLQDLRDEWCGTGGKSYQALLTAGLEMFDDLIEADSYAKSSLSALYSLHLTRESSCVESSW